jgi:hypothetical protein
MISLRRASALLAVSATVALVASSGSEAAAAASAAGTKTITVVRGGNSTSRWVAYGHADAGRGLASDM